MGEREEAELRHTDRPQGEARDLLQLLPNLRRPIARDTSVSQVIDPLVREGELYRQLDNKAVHCYACAHNCRIPEGARGICQVRYNLDGRLYVPFGYVAALASDPTEKKPFFHLHPGSDTLTFGMMGCDLHCGYCQNWNTSQALRDATASGSPPALVRPEQLVGLAHETGARCVASSYNEPLITSEWAMAVFRQARASGLTTMYVSNGNATREVLEYIRPHTVGYKIDLKSMNPRNYRALGAVLDHVLDGVRMVHEMGFWLELVTLIVPNFNDSDDELREAARFIHSLSPDIPWHVTAFHTDYRMQENPSTGAGTLRRAAEIGYAEGLRYVYAGNIPGKVGEFENTRCPVCGETVIERLGFLVLAYRLTGGGACRKCGTRIPGVWPTDPAEVQINTPAELYLRRQRPVRRV